MVLSGGNFVVPEYGPGMDFAVWSSSLLILAGLLFLIYAAGFVLWMAYGTIYGAGHRRRRLASHRAAQPGSAHV